MYEHASAMDFHDDPVVHEYQLSARTQRHAMNNQIDVLGDRGRKKNERFAG